MLATSSPVNSKSGLPDPARSTLQPEVAQKAQVTLVPKFLAKRRLRPGWAKCTSGFEATGPETGGPWS
jgi:hypothetical protein